MAFSRFIMGIILIVTAALMEVLGLVVLAGYYQIEASERLVFGVALVIIASLLFVNGWYNYKSAKPHGTIIIEA